MEHFAIDTSRGNGPLLVVVPSISAVKDGNRYFLDEKAISGLRLYASFWSGRVRCVFRGGDRSEIVFGKTYNASELPFEIQIRPAKSAVPDQFISDASVVLASGDNWLDFPMADQGKRLGVPICFVIENILKTRLQIAGLSEAPLLAKAKTFLWTVMMEQKRRQAFSRSRGLQFNGTPAAEAYGNLASDVITFFDTRLSEKHMATDREIATKRQRIMEGASLRLAFTGRLEKLKGADDLIKIAAALDSMGKDFRLDIFGTGNLEPTMQAALTDPATASTLREKVRIHKPIDFDSELVPRLRSEVDLFLCCHRQSDPSCTYLETLGCGVPIMGYDNRAWRGILDLANVGWIAPAGDQNNIVQKIVGLDANRSELADKMQSARDFAMKHSFESEFRGRVDHLLRVANHPAARQQL